MKSGKTLSGRLILEFTGAHPEGSLDALLQAKISLSRVIKVSDLTYRISIHRRDYPGVYQILKRRGDKVERIRKQGLFWWGNALLRRPVLLLWVTLLFALTFWIPSRIFFLSVEGNETIPSRWILAAAEDCGIRFGVSRKQVRSEKVKNALLAAEPRLQWAGINTYGCRAVISVRERREEQAPEPENIVSSLVAEQDGYILSATVTGGNALCAPGDAVTKGQVLISGFTDCGIYIRATRAEGEILAQTNRKLRAVLPENQVAVREVGETKYKISLLIGKKRINLWKDSRISDTGCGRMYEEYYISAPGGFRLPLALCVDRYREYAPEPGNISPEGATVLLGKFSEDCLLSQTVAGQILEKQEKISRSDGLYRLEGSYVCREFIGRERREQIGVTNGKRN